MISLKRKSDLHSYVSRFKSRGGSVGFAPTMGALHEGHLSLIRKSLKENDLTICSIFVNPTQFNQKEDFDKYPHTLPSDLDLLYHAGCQLVWVPELKDIYPEGQQNENPLDLGNLDKVLEGSFRPGHFSGVVQVVQILLDAVQPDRLYMGQKDYQQIMVIRHLIESQSLPVTLVNCPILREPDGLAMSSRNVRLSAEDRIKACVLSESLFRIRDSVSGPGEAESMLQRERDYLKSIPGLRLEYLELADTRTLIKPERIEAGREFILLVAAWIGEVRLIDNVIVQF